MNFSLADDFLEISTVHPDEDTASPLLSSPFFMLRLDDRPCNKERYSNLPLCRLCFVYMFRCHLIKTLDLYLPHAFVAESLEDRHLRPKSPKPQKGWDCLIFSRQRTHHPEICYLSLEFTPRLKGILYFFHSVFRSVVGLFCCLHASITPLLLSSLAEKW